MLHEKKRATTRAVFASPLILSLSLPPSLSLYLSTPSFSPSLP